MNTENNHPDPKTLIIYFSHINKDFSQIERNYGKARATALRNMAAGMFIGKVGVPIDEEKFKQLQEKLRHPSVVVNKIEANKSLYSKSLFIIKKICNALSIRR